MGGWGREGAAPRCGRGIQPARGAAGPGAPTLMATMLPVRLSCALYTSPYEPSPSCGQARFGVRRAVSGAQSPAFSPRTQQPRSPLR